MTRRIEGLGLQQDEAERWLKVWCVREGYVLRTAEDLAAPDKGCIFDFGGRTHRVYVWTGEGQWAKDGELRLERWYAAEGTTDRPTWLPLRADDVKLNDRLRRARILNWLTAEV